MFDYPIPEEWISQREKIVRAYAKGRKTATDIAEELGYKSPSFVRMVIHEYRAFLSSPSRSATLMMQSPVLEIERMRGTE